MWHFKQNEVHIDWRVLSNFIVLLNLISFHYIIDLMCVILYITPIFAYGALLFVITLKEITVSLPGNITSSPRLAKLSGEADPGLIISSSGPYMCMRFSSDQINTIPGFQLMYSYIPPGWCFESEFGTSINSIFCISINKNSRTFNFVIESVILIYVD